MENVNLPKYLYVYKGVKVIELAVERYVILTDGVSAYLIADEYQYHLFYNTKSNQYSPNTEKNRNQQAFLSYAEASKELCIVLLGKDRISMDQYQEYKWDLNLLVEENPSVLL